ncbi:hypothetical protein F2Q69_00029802 [Brassica cretica]|uniref:Uncharacterized protein n=1 Tax=Brassica cretica TaxID=69181 RepID=A0A8S9RYY7_BRACR|nr:hypothetical protein F2Q69_00029802 [Brassica cretica]
MVQPESHQTVQTGHLGGTSDRGSFQAVYLHNQKKFQHQTNFIGFYTQEGVKPNYNQAKIFTEQGVMNFTSQRFPSPYICEYPILEGVSSPRKERPEPKTVGVENGCDEVNIQIPKEESTVANRALPKRSDRALPKRRYDISPCILIYPSMLSPEDRSEPIS